MILDSVWCVVSLFFRFNSGFRTSTCLVMKFDDFHYVFSINFQHLFLISSLFESWIFVFHSRLLLLVSSYRIFCILCRWLFANTCGGVHDRSLQNPICCSWSWASTETFISLATLCSTINLVPARIRCLCSSYIFSDLLSFVSWCDVLIFQFVGSNCSFSLIFLNRTWSIFAVTFMSDFDVSAGIALGPTAAKWILILWRWSYSVHKKGSRRFVSYLEWNHI